MKKTTISLALALAVLATPAAASAYATTSAGWVSTAKELIFPNSITGGIPAVTSASTTARNFLLGFLGIGSTTPAAKLSVHATAGGSNATPIFQLASSTAAGTATTTALSVLGNAIRAMSGSVAFPAYSFLSGTTTGISLTSADPTASLRFSTRGASRMAIDYLGNVTVGSGVLGNAHLDVVGESDLNQLRLTMAPTQNSHILSIYDQWGTEKLFISGAADELSRPTGDLFITAGDNSAYLGNLYLRANNPAVSGVSAHIDIIDVDDGTIEMGTNGGSFLNVSRDMLAYANNVMDFVAESTMTFTAYASTIFKGGSGFSTMEVDDGGVRIGTSTSYAKLAVHGGSQGGSYANPVFVIASSSAAKLATTTLFTVNGAGQTSHGGPSPAVSSCGTSPSLVRGNDVVGRVQVGTGVTTSCTLTFAKPYLYPPACDGNVEGGITTGIAASSTLTTAVFTGASALTGNVFTYQCFGII